MRYALIALALLAGCATTQELMQTGDRSEHRLKRPPALAVACMTRNLENDYDIAAMVIRPLDDGGTELIMGTALVAQARAEGAGSRVTFWLRPQWFYRKAELIPRMIAGC